jgi:hypothetical protein
LVITAWNAVGVAETVSCSDGATDASAENVVF